MAEDADIKQRLQGKAVDYVSKAGNALVRAASTVTEGIYTTAAGSEPRATMTCLVLVAVWVGLFAIGATISAENMIKNLSVANFVFFIPAIVITYAYSNIAFLALLSGLLGGLLSNLSLMSYVRVTKTSVADLLARTNSKSIAYRLEPPIVSATRSFAVYLLYIAGISIVVPGATDSTTALSVDASQYIRIAGIISAVGFAVGYDPTIFTALLGRLNLGSGGPQPFDGQNDGDNAADHGKTRVADENKEKTRSGDK